MELGTVIGPIDAANWYCMRQCRESINYLKLKRNPIYEQEIKGEQEILDILMKNIKRNVQ